MGLDIWKGLSQIEVVVQRVFWRIIESKSYKDTANLCRAILNILEYCLQKLLPFTLFSGVCIVGALMSVLLGTEVNSLFLLAFILFSSIFISIAGVSLWKAGKDLRSKLGLHWTLNTPTYEFEGKIESWRVVQDEVDLFHNWTPEGLRKPEVSEDLTLYVSCINYLHGVIVLTLGMAITIYIVDANLQMGSLEANTAVSTFAAFISVLLGSVFGALFLGVITFSPGPTEAIALSVMFILPMVYFAPASHNLLKFLESKQVDILIQAKRKYRIPPVVAGVILFLFYLTVLIVTYSIVAEIQ
ncbi:hypothetical protein [Haloarcula amylovorans]|uniref:hypothetical protein n=1 Tax=Haloarcula amylovorans TaxID=2562280 RepID=UPI001075D438|nr:hypothetical protein [Halomicroarcula amylolytica]